MPVSVALAHLDRLAAQVGPVQPKEVEGVQERLAFVPTMCEAGRWGVAREEARYFCATGELVMLQ